MQQEWIYTWVSASILLISREKISQPDYRERFFVSQWLGHTHGYGRLSCVRLASQENGMPRNSSLSYQLQNNTYSTLFLCWSTSPNIFHLSRAIPRGTSRKFKAYDTNFLQNKIKNLCLFLSQSSSTKGMKCWTRCRILSHIFLLRFWQSPYVD